MTRAPWYTHPLFIFVVSLIALGSALAIYISTYLRFNEAFGQFMESRNIEPLRLMDHTTWFNILIMSILIGLIIAGIVFIYVYYQKVIQLYRMQQNFINGFTHELKTPVASLNLFLDTFLMHEMNREEQLKYFGFMKKDTDRLSDNISQILNLAKFEDKTYRLDKEKINLQEFLESLLAKHLHIFESCDVNFVNRANTLLIADPHLLEVLFMNLWTNAVTYNKSPRPKIDIEFMRSYSKVEIRVRDNGMGLARTDLKNIFKKYYRVERAVKGSGIGLYMVQQIVKLHGGVIRAESAGLDKGTTIILELPLGDI